MHKSYDLLLAIAIHLYPFTTINHDKFSLQFHGPEYILSSFLFNVVVIAEKTGSQHIPTSQGILYWDRWPCMLARIMPDKRACWRRWCQATFWYSCLSIFLSSSSLWNWRSAENERRVGCHIHTNRFSWFSGTVLLDAFQVMLFAMFLTVEFNPSPTLEGGGAVLEFSFNKRRGLVNIVWSRWCCESWLIWFSSCGRSLSGDSSVCYKPTSSFCHLSTDMSISDITPLLWTTFYLEWLPLPASACSIALFHADCWWCSSPCINLQLRCD